MLISLCGVVVEDGKSTHSMNFCEQHPRLVEASSFCAFCFAEYVGMGGDVEFADLTMLLDLLQHVFKQNGSSLQQLLSCLGPALFRLLVACSTTLTLSVLEEIVLLCIHHLHDNEALHVWRACAMESLAQNLGAKLPVLQLIHALFSRDEEIELMLALVNADPECCAFVWARMHEAMLVNGEHVSQTILQHPATLFTQAIDLQDVNASACLQIMLQHIGGGDNAYVCLLASNEQFSSFICLLPLSSVVSVSQTIASILPIQVEIRYAEQLVHRVLIELEQHGERDYIVDALERLIQTQPTSSSSSPSCAHDLAIGITTFMSGDSKSRLYRALATTSVYWLQGAPGDVIIDLLCCNVKDVESLCLLLHTQGNDERDLNIVCEIARCIRDLVSDAEALANAVSLLCEIARIKLASSPHLIPLGLNLFAELSWWYMDGDNEWNIEFHDFLCVMLLDTGDVAIKMCAIAIQQSGYLKRSLCWVHELGIDRVKHLLQSVLVLADFPLFLSLDDFNFALRDDISRHLERIGSEVSLCVVCALVWDTDNTAMIDDSQLRAWVVSSSNSRTMSGTALVYLILLCSHSPELLRYTCTMFNALTNDVQKFIVKCLLNMTRLRGKAVRIVILGLVCNDLGFDIDVLDLLDWVQQDYNALFQIVLESHIPLPIFTSVIDNMETQQVFSVLLDGVKDVNTLSAYKLNTLLRKLLSQSSFTSEHLIILDDLATRAVNEEDVTCDIRMEDINLPTTVEGVKVRASLLHLIKDHQQQILEEEPWAVQCAVMERLSTYQFHYGDINWVCACLSSSERQPRLKQVALWRKLLINAFCKASGLQERICIATLLVDDSLLLPTGVDFQRVYDKAMALYVVDGQSIGLRLVISLSTSECIGEGYVSQSVYSVIAAAERPCTLLVLLVMMNDGERPISNAVMHQVNKHVAQTLSDERAILQLLLVIALVLHRVAAAVQLQIKNQLEALQYRFTVSRDPHESDDGDANELFHAAEFGWRLTKPFATHVLSSSLQFSDMDRLTAGRRIATFSKRLIDSCKI